MKSKIDILDCTLRDGGYVNNWMFSKKLARECYRSLSKSGVTYVEMGFRGTMRYFEPEKYGLWRFSPDELICEVTRNIRGAEIAVMGDFGKIHLDDFSPAAESPVSLVRIAAHKDKINSAITFLEEIKAKGYIASLQCMGYSTYSENEKKDLIDILKKSSVDYVYIADSYGSILPFQIRELFEPLLEVNSFRVGFHPHNNIQMAFANTLEAIRTGVHIIDSSIYGMGRGAGNLPTEIILSFLSQQTTNTYNVLPVLNCIERFFLDLHNDTTWGYELPYMISGILNCHPNYSKELLRRKTFSMEDIWAGAECIRELNPVGFRMEIVERLISAGLVSNSKASSVMSSAEIPQPSQPIMPSPAYIDRHKGREFLVLANGPNLKKYRSEIKAFIHRYDPVILGANYLAGLFKPHYHSFNNKKRFCSYIEQVNPESQLLLGVNIPPEMIEEYVMREHETLSFYDRMENDFEIHKGVILSNCGTISVLLVAVAVVMGAERVFVAGMDGYLDRLKASHNLFYEEQFDIKEQDLNLKRHQTNERFLRQIDDYIRRNGGEGVHIVTPTTHNAFYKNVINVI